MSDSPYTENSKLNIQLGDIIEIDAPANGDLNNKVFYIKYIDSNKIILINEGSSPVILTLNEDGELDDESIIAINIIDRDAREGYAQLNGLVPGTWIDIYFGGDMPLVITGLITNLENDMIEIKTYPAEDIIYIDFEYKGLPEDLLIDKIFVRSSPELAQDGDEIETDDGTIVKRVSPQEQFDAIEDVDLLNLEKNGVQPINKEIFIAADQIRIGKPLDEIIQVIDVPEHEKRFDIEKQTTDMLNELLSHIPNAKRTQDVLNNIHKLIERYKQLRDIHSNFDKGNVTGPKMNGDNHKPLLNGLKELRTKLYWTLPVVKNSKKLYDVALEEDSVYISEQTLEHALLKQGELADNWKSNVSPEEQNKYNYYIRELNSLYTPFTNNNIENYITKRPVNANMNAIVDVLNDQYSYVAEGELVKQTRFVTQVYNMGLSHLEGDFIRKSVPLTENDKMIIKSFITLPYAVYQFSRINLPNVNIMTKSDLNMHFVNYWQLLKRNTRVEPVVVDNLDKTIEFESDKFLNNIKEFILDEGLYDTVDEDELYEKYLNTFIPQTKDIFNLVKHHLNKGKRNLSLANITSGLEPFLIYHDDLTLKPYEAMVNYLSNRVTEYKRQFTINNKNFQAIFTKLYGRPEKVNNGAYVLFNILSSNKDVELNVFKSYHISLENKTLFTSEELLSKMMRIDYAKLFMSALSKVTLDLMVSNVLDKFIPGEEGSDDVKPGLDGASTDGTCNQYILSKKYFALDELEYDNNKAIYFDKKFDKTFYDILNEYKSERDTMPPDEFRLYLIEKLVANVGLSAENASRDADAMLANKRQVINGDYALLEIEGASNEIYKRINNIWVKDDKLSENVFFDSNKLFCESNVKCFEDKGECVDTNVMGAKIQKKNLREIVGEFDQEYRLDLQKIRKQIDAEYEYNLDIIGRVILVEKERKLKYNKIFLELGGEIEDQNIIVSPYEQVKQYILGQSDFIKKQHDIVKFAMKFTRRANCGENLFWLYCTQTHVKLLPTFLLRLATTYGERGDYQRELDIICAEQGTISDDGEKWVDKHSGYEIKPIAYNTEEGFTDQGYKLLTRAILEKDAGALILQEDPTMAAKKKRVYLDSDSKTILNVITAMTEYMGINVDSQMDFIIKNILEIQKKSISSQVEYEKLVQKVVKAGKKAPPSYEDAYDSSLLFLCFVFLLVAIQVSIPPVKTSKTFPGCIRSFTGYPLQGSIDKTGLIYIACVAHKIKSSIKPWSAIKKTKEENIAKKMETLIEAYIHQNKEIEGLYKLKQEFLLLNDNGIIPDPLDVRNWLTFLPPLVDFNIKGLSNVSPGFMEELQKKIRQGSNKQEEDILVLQTKQILFSLNIQEKIQKIIEKENPILTNSVGDPFLQNACCDSMKNTLAYFASKDKSIIKDNEIVTHLSDILYDINLMSSAPILFNPKNTKFVYPSLGTDYTEETIYKGFMHYCKFNNSLPISEEMRGLCLEKPTDFELDDTLDRKIAKLKSAGKNYNSAAFNQLINYISQKNIIHINFNYSLISSADKLRSLLISLDDRDSSIIPMNFREKFTNVLDTFNIGVKDDTAALRDFKNYLSRQNELMRLKVYDFVKKNSKLTKTKLASFKNCLDNISQFTEVDSELNINKSVNFMKTAIKNMVSVFPNIILNKIDYKNVVIPKHWKLSEKHNGDLKKIIKEYYEKLVGLYGDAQLDLIFEKIQYIGTDLVLLSSNTFYISPIITQGIEYHSIFDKKVCLALFDYYFYSVLIEIISLIDNSELLRTLPLAGVDEKDALSMSDSSAAAKAVGDISELDIVTGEKKGLGIKLSNLVLSFVNTICDSKKTIDLNHDMVMAKVMRSKEKEKTIITDFLRDLTDEEREIENIFKNNKLGQWGKGLQKGLTQYVKDTYDDEREQQDKQLEKDAKLLKNGDVVGANKDIFQLDLEDEESRAEEIDREEYDLGNLQEDNDDYGNEGDDNDGY